MPLNIKNTYYETLPEKFFTRLELEGSECPELLIFNERLAIELEFTEEEVAAMKKEGKDLFSGNRLLKDSVPIAQAYAGHQFGYFTMLGDGRAALLGEQLLNDGSLYDIQLKGSGRTPYSRRGDGKGVVEPMLREYIISEGMYHLGIPTTRSLAVVKTGETVYREAEKSGAVLARIAKSHIRVGTFQYALIYGNHEDLKKLADYAIDRHFSHIGEVAGTSNKKYILLIREIIRLQAELIAEWSLKGFIHGVMNTDNMSISGETIDYGPCAFMDIYHPNTVFSSIDVQGRYAYGNQPYIGLWNLTVFSESIYPLFDYTYREGCPGDVNGEEAGILIEHELLEYNNIYRKYWTSGMRRKLGLFEEDSEDEKLFKELLDIMKRYKADYTNTFVALTKGIFALEDEVNGSLYGSDEFKNWQNKRNVRIDGEKKEKGEVRKLMEKNNPVVIPRNHAVEDVLEKAGKGDYKAMGSFLEIISEPYNYEKEIPEKYLRPKITKIPYRTYCGT